MAMSLAQNAKLTWRSGTCMFLTYRLNSIREFSPPRDMPGHMPRWVPVGVWKDASNVRSCMLDGMVFMRYGGS
jgi:hypothetical protein